MIPGEIIIKEGNIQINEGHDTVTLTVLNTGDRPIQVGSHFHFFEVNRYLSFCREKAYGYRLDIPSGTAVRFEPGQEKAVTLTAIGGNRRVHGLNRLTMGQINKQQKPSSMAALNEFLEAVKTAE